MFQDDGPVPDIEVGVVGAQQQKRLSIPFRNISLGSQQGFPIVSQQPECLIGDRNRDRLVCNRIPEPL